MGDNKPQPPSLIIGVDRVPGIGFKVFEERCGNRKYLIIFGKYEDANEEACRLFSLAESIRNLDPSIERGPLVLQLWDTESDE